MCNPTEAQVEAAAKAMWELRKRASDPEWEGGELDHGIKEIYRQDARAALVAAAAATPQAEGECLCTLHYEDRGGGHSELMLEPEPACPEHGRGLVALPSSTVDEAFERAKLTIEGVHQVHGVECLCGFKSNRSRSRTEHITHALKVEWLKEQGR